MSFWSRSDPVGWRRSTSRRHRRLDKLVAIKKLEVILAQQDATFAELRHLHRIRATEEIQTGELVAQTLGAQSGSVLNRELLDRLGATSREERLGAVEVSCTR